MCVIYSLFFILYSLFFILYSLFFILVSFSYFLFLISYFLFSFNPHSLFSTPPSQKKQIILSSSSLWHPLFCCSLFSFPLPHCSHLWGWRKVVNDCCLFFFFFRKLSKDILWLTPPTHLISWLRFPPLYSFPLLLFFSLLGPFPLLFLSCCDYFERKPSPPPSPRHTTNVVRGLFFSYSPFSIKKKTGEKLFIWGLGLFLIQCRFFLVFF